MEKIKNELKNFYNNIFIKHMKKSFLICFIIMISIVIFQTVTFMDNVEFMNKLKEITFIMPSIGIQIFNDLVFLIIVIMLGSVPYAFASIIATPFIALQYSFRLLILISLGKSSFFGLTISALFRILAFSLVISYSILMSKKSTLKFRLSSLKGYNFSDFKKDVYNMSKKDNKAKQIEKKKNDKIKETENKIKNINTNFETMGIVTVISTIVIVISVVLEKII